MGNSENGCAGGTKAVVTTIITEQRSYDRVDEVIKTKVFGTDQPISSILEWVRGLERLQMEGTLMSNVCIDFRKEDEV